MMTMMSTMRGERIYRVDEHIFRISLEDPNRPAEVLRVTEWSWNRTPLASGEVVDLMYAQELSKDEVEQLRLPD